MYIFIAIAIGIVFGVAQFLLLKRTLKPLSKGKDPKVGVFMVLKFPVPIILLVGCAIINIDLLPYTGGAFCLSLFASSIVNHFISQRKGA